MKDRKAEMAEKVATEARQIEKRKWLDHLRKTLEQNSREGWFFPSLEFCEMAEKVATEA